MSSSSAEHRPPNTSLKKSASSTQFVSAPRPERTELPASPEIISALDVLILFLAKWFLLVDAGNGLLLKLAGLTLPLSAVYKSALLGLLLLALFRQQVRTVVWPLAVLLLLLPGPLYSLWLTGNQAGFVYDAGMMLKLISPLLAALYFFDLTRRAPAFAGRALHQVFLFSLVILLLNLLAGRLGFGFEAYLPNDYLPDLNLGTKGFFKATNELSALLLLLSGYLLACYWPKDKFKFVLVSAVSLFCASSMLTKTGIGGVLLLMIFIPLLQEKARWQAYRTPLLLGTVTLMLCALVLLWQLPLLLSTLGIGQKLQLVYQQQGLLGVLLSSRDLYVLENWQLSASYFSDWHRLAGIGVTGLELYTSKSLAEIDPADLVIWYGMVGLAFFLLWFAALFRLSFDSYRRAPTSVAAGVLVINLLLLLVACLAGHTLTSGMLWIPWGMLNGAWLLWQSRPQEVSA